MIESKSDPITTNMKTIKQGLEQASRHANADRLPLRCPMPAFQRRFEGRPIARRRS